MTAVSMGVWIGRVISALATLAFLLSAFMKFKSGPALKQPSDHLGIPVAMAIPLALPEIACVVI